MHDFKKAAQLALDAMKSHGSAFLGHEKEYAKAMVDLEQALEQQPADEPVAWMYDWDAEGESVKDWLSKDYDEAHSPSMGCHNIRPLYTRPQPAREWVGLTDDEIESLYFDNFSKKQLRWFAFARAIEAKLKEKNHG